MEVRQGLIDPPFNFNSPNVSRYAPEVTGMRLLNCMCRRLGWRSLEGKRILDFGCGVRFVQTIINLEVEIGSYVGVDVNVESIGWLRMNVADQRMTFHHIDMKNPMYNPNGSSERTDLLPQGLSGFDVVCMFSVITHQAPEEIVAILQMVRRCSNQLYFTALIDDALSGYVEKDQSNPRHLSAYPTKQIVALSEQAGWRVARIFPPTEFQQTAFVCQPFVI